VNRVPGIAWLLAAMAIFFSVFGPRFASAPNLINIGTQSSILLLLALPMTLIVMTEGMDLSMGAVLALSGVVLAMLLVNGVALPFAFAAAVGVGLLFGIANGVLVVSLGIPPFVATLGVLGVAQGIALVLTNGQSIVGIGTTLPGIYASRLLGLPFSIVIATLVYGAFHLLLYRTRLGTYVFAIGGNREALVLAGVPADRYHVLIYAIGGLMAGAAGLSVDRAG
jgi:ribose transport system permease protein